MFNRIKRFLNLTPPPPHEIVQCETKAFDSPTGPQFVILLAANLHDPNSLDSLVEALIERFKVHRMISPPETSMLLVTVLGPCKAMDIVSRWRERVSNDQIAGVWMDRMEKADLAVGPARGNVGAPKFYSLLKNGGEPEASSNRSM